MCGWVDLYNLGIAAHPVRVYASLSRALLLLTLINREVFHTRPRFLYQKWRSNPIPSYPVPIYSCVDFFFFFPILVYYLYSIPENEFPFLLQELRPIKVVMHCIVRRGIIRNVLNLRSVGIQ